MSYGISQIENDDGDVVIDPDHPVLRVVHEGQTAQSSNVLEGYPYGLDVSFSYVANPILFVRADAAAWTGAVVSNTRARIAVNGLSGPINWMICDSSPAPNPNSGYGMSIFNAAGQAIFNTNTKYARVVDAWSQPEQGAFDPTVYVTHEARDRFSSYIAPFSYQLGNGYCNVIFVKVWQRTSNSQISTFYFGHVVSGADYGGGTAVPSGHTNFMLATI